MLVETDNLVSAELFRKELGKYIAAAQTGCGPVAITRDSEIVGFFVGRAEYEAMFGGAVAKLLDERSRGKTVSQEEARNRIAKVIARRTT